MAALKPRLRMLSLSASAASVSDAAARQRRYAASSEL